MESWIKLHRKIREWEWYSDPIVKSVFLELLLTANHTVTKWRGITLDIGETVIGRKELALKLGITEQNVRTALTKLERTNTIKRKSTNKFTIVKVLNYSNYQHTDNSIQPTINQQSTGNQPTVNQQLTTLKEYKDLKNNRQEEIYINNINNRARAQIINLYEQNIGVPSPMTREILADLISSHSADLVELAIEEAVKSNARNLRYIESIIHRWDDLGVKTLIDAKLAIAEHQSNKAKAFNQSKGGTHDSIKPNTEKPKPIYGSLIV